MAAVEAASGRWAGLRCCVAELQGCCVAAGQRGLGQGAAATQATPRPDKLPLILPPSPPTPPPPSLPPCCHRRAFNVGKGGAWLLPWLCQNQRLQPSECAIVGDRLDTDILLGLQGRLGLTVLPLTGVTTEEDLAAAHPSELPHYVVPNLAALAGLPTDE